MSISSPVRSAPAGVVSVGTSSPSSLTKQYAVVSKTAQGKQAVKMLSAGKLQELIARKQAIDSAVRQVVTEAPTTLPTVQIKVSSPFTLTSASRTKPRPCTAATMALKHPIPAASTINASKHYNTSVSASVAYDPLASAVMTNVSAASASMQALPAVTSAPTALVSIKTTPVIHATEATRPVHTSLSTEDVISRIGTVSLSTKPHTVQVVAAPKTVSSSISASPAKIPPRQQTPSVQQTASSNFSPKAFDLTKLKQQGLMLMKTANGQLQLVRSSQLGGQASERQRNRPEDKAKTAPQLITVSGRGATDRTPSARVLPTAQPSARVAPTAQLSARVVPSTQPSVRLSPAAQSRPAATNLRPMTAQTNQTRMLLQQGTNEANQPRQLAVQSVAQPAERCNSTVQAQSDTDQSKKVSFSSPTDLKLHPRLVNTNGPGRPVSPGVRPVVAAHANQPRLVLVNVNGQLVAQALPNIAVSASGNVQLVQAPTAGLQLVQQPALQLAAPAGALPLLQQQLLSPVVYQGMAGVQAPVAMVQGTGGIQGQMAVLPTGQLQLPGGLVQQVSLPPAVVSLQQVFHNNQ